MKKRSSEADTAASVVQAMNSAVRFRTGAVLAVILLTAAANLLRLLTAPDQSFEEVPIGVPAVMGFLLIYESITFSWLVWLRDHDRPLPVIWMYVNAAMEALAPTALAYLVSLDAKFSLHGAFLGPASHLYGIFIVLSVLHVRLLVSLLAGSVAAIGLASMVVVSSVSEGSEVTELLGLPRSLEGLSAVFVFLTGVAASLVAVRMKGYLESAASEAKRRMRAEQDLQAAALIQQGLMPSESPQIPGYQVVGWNRPADETGGDYFDWVSLDDGRFAVCIADVTGHGLGPAMITCFCRAYARTALRVESRVARALGRLNAELVNDLGDGRFVTFAAVVITPNENRVLSVSAGHGPLLVHRLADEGVNSFSADTVPLGVYGLDEEVEAVSHELEEGDTFLLLTDGFFEWSNAAGEQFGTKRLQAAFARFSQESPQGVIDGLLSEVEAFVGDAPQPDDLTAVVIRRTATRNEEGAA